MKLPNRTGSVCKLSGRRRRPWMARVYTPSGYAILGYYRLRSEAMTALMTAAGKSPPAAASPTATLKEVYEAWSFQKAPKVAPVTMATYQLAWKRLASLHSKPIRYITVTEIEEAVARSDPPPSIRKEVKKLLGQLFKYAMAHDLADSNPATLIDIAKPQVHKTVRKVFTYSEVAALFLSSDPIDKMILVGLYTGMRPCELISLSVDEVSLSDQMLYISGSKTKSGLFRHIPIHPAILSIITELSEKALKSGHFQLFLSRYGTELNYPKYRYLMRQRGHTCHDTRHSFVSYARKSQMDSLAVKRIIGHSVSDITEAVYTHLDDAFLTSQMAKFAIL